jgi:maltose O-acetyltransferase
MRSRARQVLRLYNETTDQEPEQRQALLSQLLGAAGAGVWIEPPFYCDYGSHLFLDDNVYFNFNCVVLDCNTVHIGAGTLIGPAVQIYAATHSADPVERAAGPELALPITIGRNVWIGGAAIIGPGVTIGDNTTIGAGSVVVRSLPADVVAAGNPCRVIKRLRPRTGRSGRRA